MRLTQDQQIRVVKHISSVFTDYKNRSDNYREEMNEIYDTVNNFRRVKHDAKQLDDNRAKPTYEYLVNKAFEIENKIVPKVFGSSPNWIVTFKPTYEVADGINTQEMADMVRDYLEEQYKKQDFREILKIVCKWGIRYGNAFVKVGYKYKLDRTKETKEVEELDEYWQPLSIITNNIKEEIADEYACIEYKGWSDMYYDPRYLRLEDMPAIIEVADKVRLSFFTQNKSKYMNVDKLVECVKCESETLDQYKTRVFTSTGIHITDSWFITPSTLEVKKYYWYFDLWDDEELKEERLYEFWTVNDLIVVYAKEITYFPFEDFRVFIDPEFYFAKGYIQSIIWLQNELNHQKITAQEYINRALYPPMIRSPNSGIDPRQLVNPKPWSIIVTTKWWDQALANMVQYPFRELQSSYRQNANDLERQIQAGTFTIDTSNPLNQQALTNTATGAKIKEFESNAVTGDTRKEFETMMARVAYKLLQAAYDNMDWNIKVPKKDWTGDREVNKEAFKNALSKYNIRIEAWSSSFDSVEQRRNDSLAQFNLAMQAMQAWIPVDMKYQFEKVMQTFEWVDTSKLFIQEMPNTNLSNMMPNDQPA